MSSWKERIGAFLCGGLLAALVVFIMLYNLGFFSFIQW